MALVDTGATDYQMMIQFPSVMARYSNFIIQYRRARLTSMIQIEPFVPLDGWQTQLVERLNQPPCNRGLTWIYSDHGRVGKSYFATHYRPGEVIYLSSGNHADIYYVLSQSIHTTSVVWFDYPRDKADTFPYSIVEQLKNCMFISTKYVSSVIRHQPVHVVVTTNFAPEWCKLSNDRWISNVWFLNLAGVVEYCHNPLVSQLL